MSLNEGNDADHLSSIHTHTHSLSHTHRSRLLTSIRTRTHLCTHTHTHMQCTMETVAPPSDAWTSVDLTEAHICDGHIQVSSLSGKRTHTHTHTHTHMQTHIHTLTHT